MRIVLASASPRRKELLTSVVSDFDIIIPNVDESPLPFESPQEHAQRLSWLKANAVIEKTNRPHDCLIIASDTIVVCGDIILGKPKDYHDAVAMLSMLSGKTHFVCTAITLYHDQKNNANVLTDIEQTAVTFKHLSSKEIVQYLSLIEWHDKAGSYAAQQGGEMIISEINGSYTNVIGFPLRKFFSMVETLGLSKHIFLNDTPQKDQVLK